MLSLSMISNYLQDNPDIGGSRKRTRASTKAFMGKFEISLKSEEENLVCYNFDGKDHFIKIEAQEEYEKIVDISCDDANQCSHQNILLNLLSEKLKEKEEQEELIELQQLHRKKRKLVPKSEILVKRQKLEIENSENDSKVANIQKQVVHEEIQIKKRKKIVELPEEKLENVQVLKMENLIKMFGRGGNFQEFTEFCIKKLDENPTAIEDANELTIEQADTKIWHELRIARITASRVHEATRCTTKNGSLTDKFMGKSSGFSFAMMRGTVLEEFVFEEVKKEYPKLQRSGLMINAKVNPFYAASPDGIHEDFVLEIKCPGTPNTFLQYTNIEKLSKKYFAQIQLQMHITEKKKALLAVASLDFETTREITKIWIPYDETYVTELIAQSLEFYEQAIFPALKRKFLRK